jgi:geranylgeranyl pyrophosphate synthase
MRSATGMFEPDELERLAPRARAKRAANSSAPPVLDGDRTPLDPIVATEAIAYDFLAKGGKHSRPFITLAVYDALAGGLGTLGDGSEHVAAFSDAVKRTALSIETFHKASLVHDDIEDDDAFRYGDQTVHRRWGLSTAINVGDYLIGLGYRLVSREAGALGPLVAADILDRLADAHMKLCEGQGAELLWRDARDKRLTPIDALKIYALKTAPAFEAALIAGARLAGPAEKYVEPLAQFARHLGVAFQILNDLNDWQSDGHNKLAAGGDVLGGRPTILWALALESLDEHQRRQLEALVAEPRSTATLQSVGGLYQSAGVFEKAARLVEKYQQRAEAVADEIEPDELRRLLYYLIDTVLDRPTSEPVESVPPMRS